VPPASPAFQLDVPQLEVEHRQIHRRVERIRAALEAGSEADVRAGLHFLERYLRAHFEHEERWMEERGYPGLLEHARLHASLLAKLEDARRALELVGCAARAVRAVGEDLDRHLDRDDQKLVRFHEARESLRRLAGEGQPPAPRAVRPGAERMTPLP
jgi:hemerythrin-like metal-binding protein